MNASIIYYTSNRENMSFERKVRETILENCGGLPIVSVSQEPLDFGTNICVGDVGASGFNCFRQIQIALREVKTEFVIATEADCLYPPDYFQYRPERNDVCYRNSNLYVMPDKRDFYFYKKEGATHAQIMDTKCYLDRLNELFKDAPLWSTEEMNFPRERHHRVDIFDEVEHFNTKNPVVQIKTHKGLRYYTHSDRTPIYTLPYWGDGKVIRKKYLYDD